MKKNRRLSLICLVVWCLLAGIFGFWLGWDGAVISNDSERIVTELSEMTAYSDEELSRVTKSKEGFAEAQIIEKFLGEFEEQVQSLKEHTVLIDELLEHSVDEGNAALIQMQWAEYSQSNENAYRTLKEMASSEEKYLRGYIGTLQYEKYEGWTDEWYEDLQYAPYKDWLTNDAEPVYKENVEKLNTIKDWIDQVQGAEAAE